MKKTKASLLLRAVVIVLFVPSCGTKVNATPVTAPSTLFLISENLDENKPSLFSQIDWSWSDKILIQDFELEHRKIFIGNINDKSIFPIYLGSSVLSSLSIPKISNDGHFLGFQANEGNVYIASVDSIISHKYSITSADYQSVIETRSLCNLDWASDSQRLISVCLTPRGIIITLYSLMSKKSTDIFEYSEAGIFDLNGVSWSSDKTMLAFSLVYGYNEKTDQKSQADIFIYQFGAGSLMRLTNSPDYSERSPNWYPGTQILTYTTAKEGHIPYLAFSTSDGKCTKIITTLKDVVSPSWSPDGSQLAYISDWESVKVLEASKFVPSEFLTPEGLCKAAN